MLRTLFNKYKDIILYLVFGVLTTLANYAVYYPLYNWGGLSATLCNCVSWAAAVIVAFLTNKPFVFKSHDWSFKTTFSEFSKFIGCRLGSGIVETLILFITVDCLNMNGNVMKLLISVFVVVVNYFASKLLVFVKTKDE